MKALILALIISNVTFATCMMRTTLCIPNTNFENTYEIMKVSCSPPGGPVHTKTHFNIYNPLSGVKPLVSKKLNFTRDNYFQAKLETVGKSYFLSIDDRSLSTETNINISTDVSTPKELNGYSCKELFQ
jgi:hypothetical protein